MKGLIRSFISIDVEDDKLLDLFQNVQRRLMETDNVLKTVERRNMHLTLRFLGELPQSTVKLVMDGLKSLRFKPFNVEFKGLGVFPSRSYMRVIWIGIGEGVDEFKSLHAQLNEILRKLGFRGEMFSPHLTIARVKAVRDKAGLSRILEEYEDTSFGFMEVSSVRLKRSTLTSKGPVYTTMMEVRASP